jgi:hypothetical protein
MPLAHFSVTVFAIRALAVANGQLGIADGINCPAMWAVKTIAMAELPSSMRSGVHNWSSPSIARLSEETASVRARGAAVTHKGCYVAEPPPCSTIAEAIGDQFLFAGAVDRPRTLDSPICHKRPDVINAKTSARLTNQPEPPANFRNLVVPQHWTAFSTRSGHDYFLRQLFGAKRPPGPQYSSGGPGHRVR